MTCTLAPGGSPRRALNDRGDPTDAAAGQPDHPLPLERRVDLDPARGLPTRDRLRAPHEPSGARPARDLPRRDQRVRDLLPIRRRATSSKVGQLAGNHFATIVPDDGWRTAARDRPAGAVGGRPADRDRSSGADRPVTDLLVRGGTVVTRDGLGSRPTWRWTAVGSRRSARTWRSPSIRPGRSSTRPGCSCCRACVDVHTHTRVASDDEPDRFFQDSVAAAFGGTTTFLRFNNPGPASAAAAARSLMAGMGEWRAATAERQRRSTVGLSLVDDAASRTTRSPSCRRLIAAGVPTFKAFMVYDFAWSMSACSRAREMGRHGGLLEVHCEKPTMLDARVGAPPGRGQRSTPRTTPTRPPERRGRGDAPGDRARPGRRRVGLHRPPVVRGRAGRGGGGQGRGCAGLRRDLSPLPDPDRRALRRAGPEEVIRTSSRHRSAPGPIADALWVGLRAGDLDLVATDHVPDRARGREALPGAAVHRRSATVRRGSRRCCRRATARASPAGRISVERMVDLLATTPARLFGLADKGAIEVGRDADLVLFDPRVRPHAIRAGGPPPHAATSRRTRAARCAGGPLGARPRPAVVRDGRFVGSAGPGGSWSGRRRLMPRRRRRVEQRVGRRASGTRRIRRPGRGRRAGRRPRPSAPCRPVPRRAPAPRRGSSRTARRSSAGRRRARRRVAATARAATRQISAVAASSMRLLIAAAPLPRSQEARYCSATLTLARTPPR